MKYFHWKLFLSSYFLSILNKYMYFISLLILILRNYCAYSKYYIVKKAKKLNIIYCVIQNKNMYKTETKWFLVFLVWFKISVMPHNRIWKAYELLYSLQKWLMGFKNSSTCIQKEILKILRKLIITQWLRSD